MFKIKNVFLLVVFIGLIFGFYFYWKNLRGAWPAFAPPKQNIATLLEKTNETINKQKRFVGRQEKAGREDVFVEQGPLTLLQGLSITTFADNLGKPRVLQVDKDGTVLVSIPAAGQVVALTDDDNDGKADKRQTVLADLNKPHGLALWCPGDKCKLFVAETDKVVVYEYDYITNQASQRKVIADLPGGGRHWTRTIKIAEIDNTPQLLISVGSSCDTCFEDDWRRAKILRANLDGSNLREFASGLRNSVFLTVHPLTGEIWATEMGRDYLGDELPPDEINIIKEGKNYGWPICYGKRVYDEKFGQKDPDFCLQTEPSYIDVPAHSAPLGLAFVPFDSKWPNFLAGDLLVAYHGSWNRTVPRGYKIKRFKLDENGRVIGQGDFISGWLQRGESLGRPVDILILPEGVMYISDDKAGVIYQVKYNG